MRVTRRVPPKTAWQMSRDGTSNHFVVRRKKTLRWGIWGANFGLAGFGQRALPGVSSLDWPRLLSRPFF